MRRGSRRAVLCTAGLCIAPLLLAHAGSPLEPRALTAASIRQLAFPPFSWGGNPGCDADGDSFYWVFAADVTRLTTDPRIVEVESPSGDVKVFRLPPDLLEMAPSFGQFAVSGAGEVSLLNYDFEWHPLANKGVYQWRVFRFDQNGHVAANVALSLPPFFFADEFATADDGSMFVGGFNDRGAPKSQQGMRDEVIFDPGGKLISTIGGIRERTDLKTLGPGKMAFAPSAVWGGDGDLYFLKAGQIVVTTTEGMFLRRIPFQPPGPGVIPLRLNLSGGWIAIEFATADEKTHKMTSRYMVVDDVTGNTVGLYAPTEETGWRASCFSRRDGFTFLRIRERHLQLVTAQLP